MKTEIPWVMILQRVDALIDDYKKRNTKDPELILINFQDAEILRFELIKQNSLDSEADVEYFRNARIIRSRDLSRRIQNYLGRAEDV